MNTKVIHDFGAIDLTTIEENEDLKWLLYEYFKASPKTKIYKKEKARKLITKKGIYQFQFKNDILRRKHKFEVISNDVAIGEGAMGSVVKIDGTLIPESVGRVIVDKSKKRVDKIQISNLNRAKLEAALSRKAMLQGAKKTKAEFISNKDTITTHNVMPLVSGTNLFELIQKDTTGVQLLSESEKIKISILLLRALQEQVHDNGIIHHDIKPENIMIDLDNDKVVIIDYGVSKVKGTSYNENSGTFEYMPKERIEFLQSTEKSDVYAMGMVLSKLWNMPATIFNEDLLKDPIRDSAIKDSKLFLTLCTNYKANDPSFSTNQLVNSSINNKFEIIMIIQNMTHAELRDRYSSDEALMCFENLRLDPKLNNSNTTDKDVSDLNLAHDEAWECRQEYRKLAKSKMISGVDRYKQIKHLINKHLAPIADKPIIIEEFVETLGIPSFYKLKSKEDINKKMDELYNQFQEQTNKLFILAENMELMMAENTILMRSDPIAKNTIESLLNEIYRALDKDRRYNVSFHSLEVLNEKLSRAVPRLEKKFNLIHKQLIHNELFKNPILDNVINIRQQLSQANDSDPLRELKNQIRRAISDYMKSNFTSKNIRKMSSAASLKRVEEMNQVLTLLNNQYTDANSLIDEIHSITSNMKRGIFSTNMFFFKLFGKSNLVNCIQHAIRLYQKKHPESKTHKKPLPKSQ